MKTEPRNQHNLLPLDKWQYDPFWKMPRQMSQRDFDLLFDFTFAFQSFLLARYPHLRRSDPQPWPDYDPFNEGDDSIPY